LTGHLYSECTQYYLSSHMNVHSSKYKCTECESSSESLSVCDSSMSHSIVSHHCQWLIATSQRTNHQWVSSEVIVNVVLHREIKIFEADATVTITIKFTAQHINTTDKLHTYTLLKTYFLNTDCC